MARVLLLTRAVSLVLITAFALAAAPTPAARTIRGAVVDAATALPVAGATIVVPGTTLHATSGSDGRFALATPTGRATIRVAASGYEDAAVTATAGTSLVVALTRGSGALPTIGTVTTEAAQALTRSTTLSQSVAVGPLAEQGYERIGDALRDLPGVRVAITGDTPALSDDIPLDVRGIGALETATEIDGHPVALGFKGGYNEQLSPTAPFGSALVTYGSGSDVMGISAIGGVVDFVTINPTLTPQATVTQSIGNDDRLATILRSTGTAGRLGYALALGADGLDGPIAHQTFYQPGASFDPSNPADRAAATYEDDASASDHDGMVKLRYALGPDDTITETSLAAAKEIDKTGNGDGDSLPYDAALAFGNELLADSGGTGGCAAGTFPEKNAAGKPAFVPCQTPAQYAAFTTGYQGNGPAWQSFDLVDDDVAWDHVTATRVAHADVFTDRYENVVSRAGYLPDPTPNEPYDLNATVGDSRETETGFALSEDAVGRNNTLGLALSELNAAFSLEAYAKNAYSLGAPIIRTQTAALRDVYHVPGSPLSIFANLGEETSTATHKYSLDPRASVVYAPTSRDVVRVSAGATTTQPSADMLGAPFVASNLTGAGGGSAITCGAGSIVSIGSIPSSALDPERGVDEEVAYAHRTGVDSLVQLAIYNVDVYDKLYKATIPLSATGTAFLPPGVLDSAQTAVEQVCGTVGNLGVTGNFNIGRLRSRGATVAGRQRLGRRTVVEYDGDVDSTVLVGVTGNYLQQNLTIVPGAQLPRLPLHTADLAIDRLFGRALHVKYALHWVGDNNTKRIAGGYDWSDLGVTVPAGTTAVTLGVLNVLDQYQDGQLRYAGEPYALNAYATAAAYAPFTGAAASELFGIAPRTVTVSVTARVR